MCISIYSMIFIMLFSAGCSTAVASKSIPMATFTPTPERLKLINGEIDACLLINPTEVEAILGFTIASKIIFFDSDTGCKYYSKTDGRVVLLTSVTTNRTLKKAHHYYSAVEWYDMQKMLKKKIFKVEDIDNFGDQAYVTKGSLINIYVLKNGIIYNFNDRPIDVGGIGYDALMKLAKIALQRMP